MPYLLASSFLFGMFGQTDALWAQQQPASEQAMSLSDSTFVTWSEAATYEIDRLRLLRWLRAHHDTMSVAFLSQVVELQREADAFAKQHDYMTAQLILDTALELTGVHTTPAPSSLDSSQAPTSIPVHDAHESTSLWEWRREMIFGVDLWRQEFEFGFTDQESLYVDRDGNPFIGLRISLNQSAGLYPYPQKLKLPSPAVIYGSQKLNVAAYAMLKSSRDYHSGELELNGQQSFGGGFSWRFGNRLEGIRYRRGLNLQYWQNTTSASAAADLGENLRLEIADELRWRRYREQSEIYPNYIQNQARIGAIFDFGYTTRLDSRYSFIVRAHDFCDAEDYLEHRVDASIFQNTTTNSSIFLENIWRNRIYPNHAAGNACRSAYLNTYQEEYARADLRLGLSDKFGLRVEGDFTLRQHDVPSDSTPDFLHTTVNPQVQFKLLSDLQVSVGYLYLLRVHDKDIIQLKPTTAAVEPSYLLYEDYYSHGFTFGVDLIHTNGLLLSVNEVYEVRTYPNVSDRNFLYSDRNINSLLLFFSWNFLPNWHAGILANFDNDHSRTDNQGDSRHTLFAIDLGYSF